ncbi:hypothetical protein ACFYM2_23315 [Streptomyces sp. NPDC006711]|uniref:hypothetical protein n=1 Tax=unclassified Streptomyces TaxID=2593676 RepID=UPI0033F91891
MTTTRTTQWGPYGHGHGHGHPGQGRPAAAGRWLAADGPDGLWWIAPAVCTLGLALSIWVDVSLLPGIWRSEYLVLLYAVPAGLVLSSWLIPHRRRLRALRIWLAAGGATAGFLLVKLFAAGLMVLLMAVALMWGANIHD